MIEGLSRRTNVRLRHTGAPLLKEREQYLEHLCARGICRMGIRVTAAYLIHVIRVMELSVAPYGGLWKRSTRQARPGLPMLARSDGATIKARRARLSGSPGCG